MIANLPRPLPLPASAIPDGCVPWNGEQARRWVGALPPRPVPVRLPAALVAAVVLAAGALAGGAARFAGVPG